MFVDGRGRGGGGFGGDGLGGLRRGGSGVGGGQLGVGGEVRGLDGLGGGGARLGGEVLGDDLLVDRRVGQEDGEDQDDRDEVLLFHDVREMSFRWGVRGGGTGS